MHITLVLLRLSIASRTIAKFATVDIHNHLCYLISMGKKEDLEKYARALDGWRRGGSAKVPTKGFASMSLDKLLEAQRKSAKKKSENAKKRLDTA